MNNRAFDPGATSTMLETKHHELLLSSSNVEQRKLVILGLPWDTDVQTLRQYFSQYGPIEEAVVMSDRYTGKSRGFGFVTYMYPADAQSVVCMDHYVDGRRCEAKFALPRGGTNPNRTTRIFVARIPPSVSDQQFRLYFEQYGSVQDAYMPKDASKSGHRGIGFVTFASADSVEKVMSTAHVLNGQELAIDRATPKDKQPPANGHYGASKNGKVGSPTALAAASLASLLASGNLGGMNVGALLAEHGIFPTSPLRGMVGVDSSSTVSSQGVLDPHLEDVNNLTLTGKPSPSGGTIQALQGLPGFQGSQDGIGIGLGLQQLAARAHAQAHQAAVLQAVAPPSAALSDAMTSSGSLGGPTSPIGMSGGSSSPTDSLQALLPATLSGYSATLAAAGSNRRPSAERSLSASGPADANAGPRIFVGKLNKDTTEGDVKDYFTRFGYVLDVYMPRDKNNRREHRGFGFVTFETEAAVKRVAAHIPHQIKGSIIAIDSAVPRAGEGAAGFPDDSTSTSLASASVLSSLSAMDIMERAALESVGPARHLNDRARHTNGYRPY